MKRAALFVMLCVLLTSLNAQTVDKLGGIYWQKMTDTEKVHMVAGIVHGQVSIIFSFHIYGDDESAKMLSEFFKIDMTPDTVIAGIDEFYSDLENIQEPIFIAYLAVTGKIARMPNKPDTTTPMLGK